MPKSRFPLPIILLFFAAIATPQTPEKPVNSKPDYSKEAAVVEQYTHKVKFESDGTSVQEESAQVRVQSDAGVQRYGLLAFSYESALGSFDIEYVRVRKPDGTVVDTPPGNIQDMAAEITRQAPFYSDIREKHAAVKGLSVGDVLEYKTVAHVAKPLAPGQFWLEYMFSKDLIVLQEQLEVSVPRDRPIKWKSPDTKPTIRDAGANRIYTWSRSNLTHETQNEQVDQAKVTWEQARGRFPQPDVQLTSFQSWDELGRWYGDLQTDRVKPSAEILAKAAEVTKGAADDDAKLHLIYNYVSTQFRYIGIAFGIGRYQPHFAAEVLANQYGDCKDKHTLLAALLNAAGIKAVPALISSQRETDADMPSPSQFNHVITAVPRGNNLLFLDTTSEVGPFQYLISSLRDKHALVVWEDKPAALLNTPANLPFPSTQEFGMAAKLDDSGTLLGSADLTVRGDLEAILRSAFRATAMPQWKDLAQRISQSLGFAGEVSDVTASSPEKTDEPFRISYKYLRKDFGDWPNHRIVAPSAFVALPLVTSDLDSLPVPLWLGEPADISLHSELELPKGYTLEPPEPIHLKRDFGEFDATYSFENGKLVSDRHMHMLKSELAKPDFPEYEKFSKTVLDDYNSFIQLSSNRYSPANPAVTRANFFMSSIRDLPDSSNPEALRLETEGREAAGRNDFQTATTSLYRSVATDPKFVRAWVTLAELLMSFHQTDSAMDAYQKAMAADPKEPVTSKLYAYSLAADSRFAEAIPVWQNYIKLAPDDADGPGNLGVALIAVQRYDQAAQALESAVKLNPQSAQYQWKLATAYLLAGNDQKAEAAYRKLLDFHTPSDMLNHAADDMAESKKTPPIALEVAQKSVRTVEDDSTRIDLGNLFPTDEELAVKLASYWATLGTVQLRLGMLDDAEKTLTASLKLTQNGVAAAHLCELYLNQHKTQAALQMCRFARSRLTFEKEPFLYHVPELIERNNARLEKLSPGSSEVSNEGNTIDQIIAMRDFKLPPVFSGTATAEFFVLLEYDPESAQFKVQDVKFISGSENLKPFSKVLTKLNFNLTSPDGNPVRVVRRGTFLCGVGCEFMLLDATASRSIPMPVPRTN